MKKNLLISIFFPFLHICKISPSSLSRFSLTKCYQKSFSFFVLKMKLSQNDAKWAVIIYPCNLSYLTYFFLCATGEYLLVAPGLEPNYYALRTCISYPNNVHSRFLCMCCLLLIVVHKTIIIIFKFFFAMCYLFWITLRTLQIGLE